MVDGRVLQGRIEREDVERIELRTAESFAEPLTISKQDIAERVLSNQSIMPAGLLNTATAAEIRALLKLLLEF